MNHGPTKREKAQLGRKLKKLREAAGIRVELMAAYLEVTSRTITNYETGHTHASKSVVLAYEHFAGVTLADLELRNSLCNQGSLFTTCEELSKELVDTTTQAA